MAILAGLFPQNRTGDHSTDFANIDPQSAALWKSP